MLSDNFTSRNKREYNDYNHNNIDHNEDNNNTNNNRNVKPKLSSVIGKVSNPPRQLQSNNISIKQNIEKPSIVNSDSIQRNKRLFAGLIGHLGSAKKKLEEDSNVIVKQSEISTIVSKKHEIEGKRIALANKIIKETEIQKELILKEKLHVKQNIDEIQKYYDKFKSIQEQLQLYLLTKGDKPIFWLPKSHNKSTNLLLNDRSKQVTKVIAERELIDKAELVKLQNQLEELNTKEEELFKLKDEKMKSVENSFNEELESNEKNQDNEEVVNGNNKEEND